MSVSQELREQVMGQVQGALSLQVAFIGVVNALFSRLHELGAAGAAELAQATGMDAGYVTRWCDVAYAFGYLEDAQGKFALTPLGAAFLPEASGTLMPFAVHGVLSAHMAERAAGLMPSGERPGEKVLAERATLLPWFGPMLEAMFGGLFEREILPKLPAYGEVDARGGTAVDLGCGNGWYLRKLAARYTRLKGIGLDGFEENIRQAGALAQQAGLAQRLSFRQGDIHEFAIAEPVDLIAMNRALHHVWDEKENVFRILKEHLSPGGVAVIWEPHWPVQRSALRHPSRRGMAFQNLAEHVQGNHFLRPEQIETEFVNVGMQVETYLFANDNEAVVVGRKPA